MLIKIESPVSLNISHLTDLKKLGTFMEDNNLKPNKSEIARQIGIDRRTVSKYMDGFEKNKHRNKPSKLDAYYDTIHSLLSSQTQVFYYRSVLYHFLCDNYGMNVPEQTFYHYLRRVPEFDSYFRKGKKSAAMSNPIIRYETPPGEQAQFDWKESIPFVLADTGEVIYLHILVIVLGHSRFRIFKPAICMNRQILMHLLTETFESIGGVPKTLLTDNMKILDEIRAYSGTLNLVELYELIERINIRVNN